MSKLNLDVRVQIYESEYKAIVAEARRLSQTETGGDLYGTFTHGSNPIIWLASGPGSKVRHEHSHFEQDSNFTTYWESRLTREFGLQYIGSWHSHHFISLQEPSSGDVRAAQTYARRHNRQTTLEIIVNHQPTRSRLGEQEFSTTLRPYFYPNAQNAEIEKFILASFIPLSGVSPIRQQLGSEESGAFNLISWQRAAGFQLPVMSSQTSNQRTTDEDAAVIIPDRLGAELQSITDEIDNFNIQQNSSVFLISITLNNGCILALVIQKPPELRIRQVNLIDQSRSINENISSKLHDIMGIRFSLNQSNKGVLRRILLQVPIIHREVVEEKLRTATTKDGQDRGRQRQDEPGQSEQKQEFIAQSSDEKMLEVQRQLQEELATVQQFDEQRRKAQQDLDEQRVEAQKQLAIRELTIKELQAQLLSTQQLLTDQQSNEQQQLHRLQDEAHELEDRLLEAQKELAKQQQLEVQLNERQQELEAQQRETKKLTEHLEEAQAKLTTQQQLEVRLDEAQQQIEVQRREMSRLEAELNETKKRLEASKREEAGLISWLLRPFRNRDGPGVQIWEEKNTRAIIVIAAILIIIIAAILVFMLSHRHGFLVERH